MNETLFQSVLRSFQGRRSIWMAVVALMCVMTLPSKATNTLFKNGKSKYKIVISSSASTSEQTAAKELQKYIKEINGAELPITNDMNCKGAKIFVGYNQRVGEILGQKDIKELDESYTYESRGKDIFIYGGKLRGTMYGVFAFLEDELGCHWYTPSFTKVPKLKSWSFKALNHSESPSIQYRYSNYHDVAAVPVWSAHNKENTKWGPFANEYGNIEGYWGAHTMGQFVTEKEFFESHPEYFAMKNGKRTKGAQLCLSNPDVLEICKQRLLKVMGEQPLYRIYSLSQNDNFGFCECDECKKLEEKYGGHSGIIVWFVNQVADVVKDIYPDKYVGTFAYQYSRKPPHNIAPHDNVVIRLCSIECCFAHPLEAGCPQNKAFMEDLRGWKAIAPHLFIWDYIVDYAQYLAPWPNFQVLGPNIQTFHDNNAIGVFEEAQYQTGSSEFNEMKTWVVTKLLWNPKLDFNQLVAQFIKDYYGQAAPQMQAYYDLCQSLVTPDKHFGIYIRHNDPIFSDEFVQKGEAIFKEALSKAENDEIRERVEKERMQIVWLKFQRNRPQSLTDGTWDELKKMMLHFTARPMEPRSQEYMIEEIDNERQKLLNKK